MKPHLLDFVVEFDSLFFVGVLFAMIGLTAAHIRETFLKRRLERRGREAARFTVRTMEYREEESE
jgi:hypothetical protein